MEKQKWGLIYFEQFIIYTVPDINDTENKLA